MRIGIDARFLTHPQRGGFKSYTTTLVSSLAEVDTVNEYILYTDRIDNQLPALPSNFTIKPVTALTAITREQFALPSAMRKDNVDIAHYLCNTAPITSHMPMIVTIHDAIPLHNSGKHTGRLNAKHKALRTYWRGVMPRAASTAELIVTNTRYSQSDIMSVLNVAEDKFRVVHPAISDAFIKSDIDKHPVEMPKTVPYIMCFAAMDGRKNHQTAIAAFKEISAEFPDLHLVLVCSHDNIKEQLKHEHGDRFLPIGPLVIEELVWLYKNSRTLIFPSFDEGFGLPPLEAMTCGTPVIASNSGSLPEVLGDAAILVETHDSAAISRGLRKLLTDDEFVKHMVSLGKNRSHLFTHQKMGRGLLGAYQEVFNLSRKRPSS